MVIIGPQQGWQCPLCRSIYSPATPMCYSCSNTHTKVTTSTGVDFDPKSLKHHSSNTVTIDSKDKVSSGTVKITDIKTTGMNPNWPYEL